MISISGPFIFAFRMATGGLKPHTYRRLGTPDITGLVGAAKSNYFRSLSVVREIGMEGYTFVLLKSDIDAITGITEPKKGDIIEHVNLGTLTIDKVEKLEDASSVFAYRIVTV